MITYGFKDKTIAITGGASGIGRAAALILGKEGAKVGIIDQRQEDVDRVLQEIREAGGQASGHAMDVRDGKATKAAADQFERELGPVVGLLASAGISGSAPAETLEEDEWTRVLTVNMTGLFLSCQEFGKRMIGRGGGSIVVISSLDGLGGQPSRTHYVASKHGVNGLMKNLALEWGRHGIRVNAIAPNLIDTPLLRRNMPPNFVKVVEDRTPLGRMGFPEEVAAASLMLMTDAASYVSGQILAVDGGLTAGYFTRKQGGDYSSKKLLDAGIYTE